MSTMSNALTLLSVEYHSDSGEERDSETDRRAGDAVDVAVKSAVDDLIGKVCLLCPRPSRQSSPYTTARFAKSDAEIDISSDASSDSSWSLSSDDDHNGSNECGGRESRGSQCNDNNDKRRHYVRTRGEICIDDLPPIESLAIRVAVDELTQMGRVSAIVDQLVVVQSFRSMPALDLDSVLFTRDGTPLGAVFDVLGPVVEPRYAVRFNTPKEISDRNIAIDTPVYFAADYQRPVTGYVFAEQLRRLRGSDASWKHNNEPPDEVKEYSDDETERLDKLKQRAKGRRRRDARSRNYWQRSAATSPSDIQVPPNTPNSPYIISQNYFNQFPHQLPLQHNWFANAYHQ